MVVNYSNAQPRDSSGKWSSGGGSGKMSPDTGGGSGGGGSAQPMPEHPNLTVERNPGMPKLWDDLQSAQTPRDATKVGKKYEDNGLLPSGHPERISDGARIFLVKSRQDYLKAQNTSQKSSSDARVDSILHIRDSTGRATGRRMT